MRKHFTAVAALLLVAFSLWAGSAARQTARPLGLAPANSAAADTADRKKTTADIPATSIIDEVIWVVGDEAILKSDVEVTRLQGEMEGQQWDGDPDCVIPEHLAVQKLFLHQAEIDSLEVTESEISQGVEMRINYMIQMAGGSKEKLEEYRNQSIAQMRQQMRDEYKNEVLVDRMKQKIVGDVQVTPADVRTYFKDLPADSLPMVPTEVEVEIITRQPKIPQEEINRVKDELRGYTDRVTRGETSFATLARLYSEDPGTARQGGELGYTGRGMLDPAFAAAAFNLTDSKKISKVVESEFGFHIIQLIDKLGDRVNVRHILLKPRVTQENIESMTHKMDSVVMDIRAGKISFEDAATVISDDKDTRNNHGLMAFTDQRTGSLTSHFKMRDLPTEVAREVEKLQPGEISQPFQMVNSKGKTVVALVKLRSRTEAHRANITEDFQVMQHVVLEKRREQVLHDWVVEKIKHTYVRMNDRYKHCNFQYEGWIKN